MGIKKTILLIGALIVGVLALPLVSAQGEPVEIIHAAGIEADSLDANDYQSGGSTLPVFHIYDRLVEIRFDPDTHIIPGLASEWDVSEDRRQWTFTLRQGATFHDGTPFNADAVVAVFDRILDESNGLRSFGTFSPIIESVEAVDEYSVAFNLFAPYAPFLNLLALPEAGIPSPTAIEEQGEDFGFNPVGTGPFEFVSWTRDEEMVLEVYEDYWGDQPMIDRLVIRPVLEPATRVIMLERGEVDTITGVPIDLLDRIRNSQNAHLIEVPAFRLRLIGINTLVPPLDDKRVRQALNYAIDLETINEALLAGTKVLMDSPLPPTDFGYQPTLRYEYDPERARELLAEAGYPDGFTISFLILQQTRDPGLQDVLQAMREYWSDVGIETDPTTVEIAAYLDIVDSPPDSSEAQEIKQLYAQGFNASLMDADYTLRRSFHCDSWAPENINRGFYCNPELDALIDEAATLTDPEARRELYAQAQEIVMEDAPHVFKYVETLFFGARNDVTGIISYPQDVLLFYEATKEVN